MLTIPSIRVAAIISLEIFFIVKLLGLMGLRGLKGLKGLRGLRV
jgi:hypothetical protein